MTRSTTTSATHLPALDGLRGVAVAAAVAYHLGWLRGGFVGVDIFFVLSGFLITRLLIAEYTATGRIDLPSFWRRRIRRLLPALAATLGLVGAMVLFGPEGSVPPTLTREMVGAVTWTSNWQQIVGGGGYWAGFATPSPLRHLWSLAIEEQFYVLHPLVVAALLSFRRRAVAGVVLAVAATVSVIQAVRLIGWAGVDRVYLGTDTRVAALLLGALLATIELSGRRPTTRRTAALLAYPAGVVVMSSLVWLSFDRLSVGRWAVLVATEVATVIVIATIVWCPRHPVARALAFRPLRALGRDSYALYLLHWPVQLWIEAASPTAPKWTTGGATVLVSLVLARVVTAYVEGPIRAGRRSVTVHWSAPCVALGLVPVLLAAALDRGGPVDVVSELNPIVAPGAPEPATDPTRVLVLGDSVAHALEPDLTTAGASAGVVVTTRAAEGCGVPDTGVATRLLDGSPFEITQRCREWRANWDGYLAEVRPDVVLIMHSVVYFGSVDLDGWRDACSPEYQRWYTDVLIDEIDAVTSTGARAALTTMAFNRATMGGTLSAELRTRRDRDTRCVNTAIRAAVAARPDRATLIELDEWVCPGDTCRIDVDGAPLRPDGLHFSGHAAEIAARWLVAELNR